MVGAIFYRAYKILTEDLFKALESLDESVALLVQREGLGALNWPELLEHGGQSSRVRHLRLYFETLLAQDMTEEEKATVYQLPNLACDIHKIDGDKAKRYERDLLEWPWLHGRPLSKSSLDFMTSV